MYEGLRTFVEGLAVGVGDLRRDRDLSGHREPGVGELCHDARAAVVRQHALGRIAVGAAGAVVIVPAVAEVVIPVIEVLRAVVAEQVVAEFFRVEVGLGDSGERFHRALRDRLALVVGGLEVERDFLRTVGGRGHGVGELEGIAAELFDPDAGFKEGVRLDQGALRPVFEAFQLREFLRVIEADAVVAGLLRGQLEAEVEAAGRGDFDRLGEDLAVGRIGHDDA